MPSWGLRRAIPGCALAWLALAPLAGPVSAYSVLSHEALIDAVWAPVMVPLLAKRFPGATTAQLRVAHAFAYGGSVIQDLGYYPLGNHFFSDVTHYARTGDFVRSLVDESRTLDEYAFALGSLSHYVADTIGHPQAVNRAVPDMYPDLRKRFGAEVTYANNPRAHVMTEFSFDVVQITGAGYLPRTYHNFIGFRVAQDLLERAFAATYGLRLSSVFLWERLSFSLYKISASEIVPALGSDVWKHKHARLARQDPRLVTPRFRHRLAAGNYEAQARRGRRTLRVWTWQWKQSTKRANQYLAARFAVAVIELLPKIGPLATLRFRAPTFAVQDLFIGSFDQAVASYQANLADVRAGRTPLPELNLDTGKPLGAGRYALADRTYARWLHRLARQRFQGVNASVREDILTFYARPGAAAGRPATASELEKLRGAAGGTGSTAR